MKKKLRLAVLDMNAGKPNQGLRCILEIAAQYRHHYDIDLFDVRKQHQIPDLSYDVYISSGGPGDPLTYEGVWEEKWRSLFLDVRKHNLSGKQPKFAFFICHSFQLACHLFNLAKITKRKKTAFGIMPVHKTIDGMTDSVFSGLDDPFFVVESRDYQIVQPDESRIVAHGASILCHEKERPHVKLERAIMGVRFSEFMIGTQFHPEADPFGMKKHLEKPENQALIIAHHGEEKYESVLDQLDDTDKIAKTHQTILPNFLDQSIAYLENYSNAVLV